MKKWTDLPGLRRAMAITMAVLALGAIALLIDSAVHPRSQMDAFLAIGLITTGIITLFRAWQLGGQRPDGEFVPSPKPWKRVLFLLLLPLTGAAALSLFVAGLSIGIIAVFLLLTANLIMVLLFDFKVASHAADLR
ncbi:hypothetical protein VUN82_09385 [Micrococcaceae bacterium Sec5.1]